MAAGAYRDKKKTEYVLAKDCTAADQGGDFYCETVDCPAILHLVSYHSAWYSPYFRAVHAHSHSESCVLNDNDSESVRYTDEGLDISVLINALMSHQARETMAHNYRRYHSDSPPVEQVPRQLKTLYNCLKARSIHEIYAGAPVMDWLIDARVTRETNPFCSERIQRTNGYHIIECRLCRANPSTYTYYMSNIVTKACNINLECDTLQIYNTLRTFLMLRKGRKLEKNEFNIPIYAVAGKWRFVRNGRYTNLSTSIQSKSQIIRVKF